jgi:hypothetical protein
VANNLDSKDIDYAVKLAAEPIVQSLKSAYEPHRVNTGKKSMDTHIGDSVQAFQRKRKGKGLYFAYYIGPKWGEGGNLAYILEYGTVERYRANVKKGGFTTTGGRTYGATYATGAVKPLGIVRKTYDMMRDPTQARLKNNILVALAVIARRHKLKLEAA